MAWRGFLARQSGADGFLIARILTLTQEYYKNGVVGPNPFEKVSLLQDNYLELANSFSFVGSLWFVDII